MCSASGTWRAYFRGNGANVLKIAPETSLRLTLNDVLKQVVVRDPEDIRPLERMVSGGLAGAAAQVGGQAGRGKSQLAASVELCT